MKSITSMLLLASLLAVHQAAAQSLLLGACNSTIASFFVYDFRSQCIFVRISSYSPTTHVTSYTEGTFYYNQYVDSLANRAQVDGFPTVTSASRSCDNDASTQPFDKNALTYKAQAAFDVTLSRGAVLTFSRNNVAQYSVQLYCQSGNSALVGFASNGDVYTVQLEAIPLQQGCPSTFDSTCTTTTSPPTSATPAPTSSTPVTPAPTSSAGVCQADVRAMARAGSSWTSEGKTYQVYDLTVTNTGTCAVTSVADYFVVPAPGQVSDGWNYDTSSGIISGFGSSIAVGGTFQGAGFIASGGAPVSARNRASCSSCA